jgi:hypothetical protein
LAHFKLNCAERKAIIKVRGLQTTSREEKVKELKEQKLGKSQESLSDM